MSLNKIVLQRLKVLAQNGVLQNCNHLFKREILFGLRKVLDIDIFVWMALSRYSENE